MSAEPGQDDASVLPPVPAQLGTPACPLAARPRPHSLTTKAPSPHPRPRGAGRGEAEMWFQWPRRRLAPPASLLNPEPLWILTVSKVPDGARGEARARTENEWKEARNKNCPKSSRLVLNAPS